MFKFFRNLFAVIGVFTTLGMVAACFHDSNANQDDDSEQIAALQKQVDELSALVQADRVFARNKSGGNQKMSVTSATNLSDIGQFLSYDQNAYAKKYATFTSSKGYKGIVELGVSGDNYLQQLTSAQMYFLGNGCTGTVYTYPDYLSPDTRLTGIVFSLNGDYAVIPAQADTEHEISYASFMNLDGVCKDEVGTMPDAIKIVPNDPTVTGFNNEPFTGPLRVGVTP